MKLVSLCYKNLPWLAFCLLFISGVSLAACQPIQPGAAMTNEAADLPIPEVLIEVNDTEFTIPTDFPGGIVRVTVQNNSSKDLDIGFARVREGSSSAEILALNQDFMNNLVPLLQKASIMMSFNPVPAGASQQAILDFKTGEFIVDATEHVEAEPDPNAAHIYGTFKADRLVGTTEPQADVKVTMQDFAFVMPDAIEAGKQLWEFTNQGNQWHMLFFVKPTPGVDMEALTAALLAEGEPAGPPPFEVVPHVGIAPISEGERVWLEFALPPGEYLVGCPIPDVASLTSGGPPVSHLQHGMHRQVTVTDDATTAGNAIP
jgi:hypothetical protein